jgi:thymidylate synthase
MNNIDKQYTTLLQEILDNGVEKKDRTGTGTISVFGRQIRHKMSEGFPLLTTKKMGWKQIVTELLWFLRGHTNIKYLVDNNCHIWDGDAYKNYMKWANEHSKTNLYEPYTQEQFINKIKTDDEFAKKWGDLGPIYGKQWRKWSKLELTKISPDLSEIWDGRTHTNLDYSIDQIANLISELKTNPDSRRLIVNAWNVSEIDQMVLPPCHYGFQLYTRELSLKERIIYFRDKISVNFEGWPGGNNECENFLNERNIPTRAISLMWNQRSVDTFLGLPFNIASYGLLLEIIAKEVNMVPDELIGNLGDVHLYSNHVEQAKEQIGRELTLVERYTLWKEKTNRVVNENMSYWLLKDGIPKHTREPYPLPKLKIQCEVKRTEGDCLPTYSLTDFILENYQSHPVIKAPLSN